MYQTVKTHCQMYQTMGFLFSPCTSFTIRITIINENFASEVTFYFKIKCYRSISKSVMFGCNCWTPWQFRGSVQPWEFRGKEPARAGVQDGHPFFQEHLFGILRPTGALSMSGFRLSAFLEALPSWCEVESSRRARKPPLRVQSPQQPELLKWRKPYYRHSDLRDLDLSGSCTVGLTFRMLLSSSF